jgi:ParB family chromosome partitioning protein
MSRFVDAFDALNRALAAEGDALLNLPLELVVEDADNPRDAFDEAELEALTATVRDKGVLQPIVVRPADAEGRYRIRFGARRFRAALRAGCPLIPAVVRPGPDDAIDSLVDQVIENDQRAGLSTAQLARSVSRLLEAGLTQAEIGARLGRPKDVIAMLAAVRVMPAILQDLAPRLGARTLYELFQAWKADGAGVEHWLSGRDPDTITQAAARALGRGPRRATAPASVAGVEPRTSAAPGSVRVEVTVDGRSGWLAMTPGPSPDMVLVTFGDGAPIEPFAAARVRLVAVRWTNSLADKSTRS